MSLNVLYDGKYFMSEKQEEQKLRQTKYNPHETENACLSCTIENEIHVRPFFCSNGGGRTMDNASDKKKGPQLLFITFIILINFSWTSKKASLLFTSSIFIRCWVQLGKVSQPEVEKEIFWVKALWANIEKLQFLPNNSRKENVDFPQNETLLDPSEMISVEMINFRIV